MRPPKSLLLSDIYFRTNLVYQRVLGTSLPGYWSGSFKKDREESFFNIRRENKPVVIQLKNEKYTRLILGVDDPENVVDLINNNIN